MSLMFEPLRKYATFTGRARRSEYWLFALFTLSAQLLGALFSGDMTADNPQFGIGFAFYCAVLLGLFVPSLAVSFRRLHDTNRSAWWLLLGFLPIIGVIVLLVFMVLDGTAGPNRFGDDPKQAPAEPDTIPAST